MGRLLLVRHSAVLVDPAIPSKEWRLSENGRSRCLQLAAELTPYQPIRFITSTEPKAMETGQILADTLGVRWETAENLHEHDRTSAPHLSSEQFQDTMSDFFVYPDKLIFGVETAEQTLNRFNKAIRHILTADSQPQTAENKTASPPLAIVSHGTVLTLFICRYNPEIPPFPFWQSLTLPCAFVLSLPDLQLQSVIKPVT